MPTVLVLPSLVTKSIPSAACDHPAHLGDHGQDVLFHCFFLYHYPHAITNVTSNEEPDLFYFPIIGSNKQLPAWQKLDGFLHNFTMTNPLAQEAHFNLDKTFCIGTFPLETVSLHHINELRNVQDIHHFRSDHMLTPNGRDVYIPYVTALPARSNDLMSNDDLFVRRKHVMMAPLREAGGLGESYRLFRTRLYSHLQTLHLEKALISNNLTATEFDEGMETSLFCLILPGDTPSTAKVYKAIFRGCIPVIFVSFPAQLPFYQFIDWSSFSLIVYKDDINFPDKIDALVQTIYNISGNADELTRMRVSMAKHAVLFNYSNWEWPSVYHLSLLSLQAMIFRGDSMIKATSIN
eukprot:scaffold8739_cov173-Ochromonas_danica.AAC.8